MVSTGDVVLGELFLSDGITPQKRRFVKDENARDIRNGR